MKATEESQYVGGWARYIDSYKQDFWFMYLVIDAYASFKYTSHGNTIQFT